MTEGLLLIMAGWLMGRVLAELYRKHRVSNEEGYSYHECSREGSELVPKETFTFGIGYFVES